MSETDIETVENVENVSESKTADSSQSERFMSHIEKQAAIIERQAQVLEEMKSQLASLGKAEPVEEEYREEDSPRYVTKKELDALYQGAMKSAYKEMSVNQLNKEINRPEVTKVINQMLEEDPVFKESMESVLAADPVKGRELILRKAKQAMAKSASVPKAMAGASSGSAGNAASIPQPQTHGEVTQINYKSTPEQKEAFAKSLYNKFIKN